MHTAFGRKLKRRCILYQVSQVYVHSSASGLTGSFNLSKKLEQLKMFYKSAKAGELSCVWQVNLGITSEKVISICESLTRFQVLIHKISNT
jgi:hypothetical protein